MVACGACVWCVICSCEIFSPSFGTFTGSEAILSQKVRGELITCVTCKGCECEGLTFSADHSDCLKLLRRHVSRNAAGRGRALLEGLGLFVSRIHMCFRGHPNDEEAAVQQGLTYWIDGEGIQATWAALLEAMKYAELAERHIQSLKADLGITEVSEGILSMCSCVMWCVC